MESNTKKEKEIFVRNKQLYTCLGRQLSCLRLINGVTDALNPSTAFISSIKPGLF